MTERNYLTYEIKPKEFKKVLKDLEQYIYPRAAKENLVIVYIEAFYSDYKKDLVYKINIDFARANNPDGQVYSENLLEPLDATIKRVFSDFFQKDLNKNRTLSEYENEIKPVYEQSDAIQIGGKSVDFTELQIKEPVDKPKESEETDNPIRLESIDFEKPRIIVGGRKIPIQPEIGEAILEVTRSQDWSAIKEQKSLDYEQLKMLLHLIQRAAEKGIKLLEYPAIFQSENEK